MYFLFSRVPRLVFFVLSVIHTQKTENNDDYRFSLYIRCEFTYTFQNWSFEVLKSLTSLSYNCRLDCPLSLIWTLLYAICTRLLIYPHDSYVRLASPLYHHS